MCQKKIYVNIINNVLVLYVTNIKHWLINGNTLILQHLVK